MNYVKETGITNLVDAEKLFQEFRIPYSFSKTDPDTIMTKCRTKEQEEEFRRMRSAIESSDYSYIADHPRTYVDDNDCCVMTYSPYLSFGKLAEVDGKRIEAYSIKVTEYSIYGEGTKTIIVK